MRRWVDALVSYSATKSTVRVGPGARANQSEKCTTKEDWVLRGCLSSYRFIANLFGNVAAEEEHVAADARGGVARAWPRVGARGVRLPPDTAWHIEHVQVR